MIKMNQISFDKEEFKRLQGKRLQYERIKKNWTLHDAERETGISYQKIHNHEEAVRNVSSYDLAKYAKAYNKSESYFCSNEDAETFSDLADDKRDLIIAAEVIRLRPEVKVTVFNLAKQINILDNKPETKEQAA